MNEQLIKYLEGFESRLSTVEDFAAAEIPLFVQEFILWNWWTSFIWSITCFTPVFLIITFIVVCWRRFLKTADFSKKDDSEVATGAFVVTAIALFPCVIGLCCGVEQVSKCIKISVAPRVFLVEESAKLVKGN